MITRIDFSIDPDGEMQEDWGRDIPTGLKPHEVLNLDWADYHMTVLWESGIVIMEFKDHSHMSIFINNAGGF